MRGLHAFGMFHDRSEKTTAEPGTDVLAWLQRSRDYTRELLQQQRPASVVKSWVYMWR